MEIYIYILIIEIGYHNIYYIILKYNITLL